MHGGLTGADIQAVPDGPRAHRVFKGVTLCSGLLQPVGTAVLSSGSARMAEMDRAPKKLWVLVRQPGRRRADERTGSITGDVTL